MSDTPDSGDQQKWLNQREFFLAVALILLLVTTQRFSGDLYAFAWSLIVLGGVMVFE
jgi:hypothetical protein